MKKLRITVDGKTYDVAVEVLEAAAPAATASTPARSAAAFAPIAVPGARSAPPPAAGANTITSPLAGKVVSIDVAVGDAVKSGDQVATIEAMKMNTFIYAEIDGSVDQVVAAAGDMVEEGGVLIKLD